MGKLDGRVAIVTGAGRGLGRAYARALAREGAVVTIAELNLETGRKTAEDIRTAGGRALFVPATCATGHWSRPSSPTPSRSLAASISS